MPTDEDLQQQRDIGKIWGAIERQNGDIREVRVALIGIDGKNGLRSELVKFMASIEDRHEKLSEQMDEQDALIQNVSDSLESYKGRNRKIECLGLPEVAELKKYMEEKEKEDKIFALEQKKFATELKKARYAMTATIIAALFTAMASILVAYLSYAAKIAIVGVS